MTFVIFSDYRQPYFYASLITEMEKYTETGTMEMCFHCGQDCAEEKVNSGDKNFCCSGCRFVYELLKDNDLGEYYSFEDRPGRAADLTDKMRYAFLDKAEFADKFLRFREGNMSTVVFHIPQVHCSSCIWLLENLRKMQDGILSSRVDFFKKEVRISFDNSIIGLRQLAELSASLGYAPKITLSDDSEEETESESSAKNLIDRKLMTKVGVAGFCFGNIMLFSLPEYFSFNGIAEEFSSVFSYLNLALMLPVLFYAGNEFTLSAWRVLRRKELNIDVPISLGLTALFLVTVYEILSGTGAGYADSLAGLVFFLLAGKIFQSRTYASLSFERDYRSYFPISVTKLENSGKEEIVSVRSLEVEDRILVRNNELIPADARLLKGRANIDYSFVTGESEPVQKKTGDLLYAGGRQVGEAIETEIVKPFSQSYLTGLWNDKTFRKKDENEEILSETVNRIGRVFTAGVILISLVSLLYHLPDWPLAIKAFSSVLIVACPCALALSAPFAFSTAMRIFGRNKFYLKNAQVTERLAEIDTVVFDKTGTLTDSRKAKVLYEGSRLDRKEKELLKAVLRQSAHPLSRQLLHSEHFKDVAVSETDITDYQEFTGKGISCTAGNYRLEIGKFSFVAPGHDEPIERRGSSVYLSFDGDYAGKFILKSSYRFGAEDLVKRLKKEGKTLVVLTGDNETEKENLERIFGKDSRLLFGQSPQNKLDYCRKLGESGRKVLMVGDGLNDAGSLKESRVGVALTEDTGTFSPAGDGILEAGQFAHIDRFTGLGRAAVRTVRQGIFISLLYNLIGLSFAVQGLLSPIICAILMPLSSVSVVAFAVFSVRRSAKKLNLTV